jgi:predicted DNA-binding transcriptional regulator YafY
VPAPQAVVRASEISFNEGVLRLAAAHKRTVTFRYAKGEGKIIEQRALVPQEIVQVGDHLTFIGYDPDRDDIRAYRVDRMLGEVTVA